MRGLTLTQPWASLVAMGAKRIETREWWTSYRGPLLIHAAKTFPDGARDLCDEEPFFSTLRDGGIRTYRRYDPARGVTVTHLTHAALPFGAIVAVADLVDVRSTNAGATEAVRWERFPPHERAFGDFSPSRYMWLLANVRALPEPIPCRGYPNVWPVQDWLQEALAAQLGEAVRA